MHYITRHKDSKLASAHLKKRGEGGCERTPPFFIKRKQHGFFWPRKKTLNPGPCPRGPNFAANTAREFFYPRVEIRPTWNSNSRPRRGDYTSAPLTN